jgi:hypothetical protein
MTELFLDPTLPLSTCTAEDCQGCSVKNGLHCHFNGRQLGRFLAIALPPFITAGIGIVGVNAWLLLPWIGMAVSYFGFIEIRVMCSHCPHYAEPGIKSLKCWANYGSPKLWKYRPGPMTVGENIVFFAGLVLITGYPLGLLLYSSQWILLVLFTLLVVVMGMAMSRLMCAKCINFACPLNRVDPAVRSLFLAQNPRIDEAWIEHQGL